MGESQLLGPPKARYLPCGCQWEKIFNCFKSFSISQKRAYFKIHFVVERGGSWTDSVLVESSLITYRQTLHACFSAVSWGIITKQEASGVGFPASGEGIVFAEKHEVTLPSSCILYLPLRVWDSKRRRYVNIELHKNITGVFLKWVASLGYLWVFCLGWLCCVIW